MMDKSVIESYRENIFLNIYFKQEVESFIGF